jgi:hypothetical protein
MKLLFYTFVLIISFSFAFPVEAQIERFPVGEKLTYHVSFANFTDAGFVELHTVAREKVGQQDAIHLRARVKTTGMVEATLLALDNEYSSFISPETGLPLKIERTLRESIAPTDIKRDFAENQVVGANNVRDLISAIYQVRTLPLALNSTFPLRVSENNQIYEVELKVVKKMTVSTAVGAFGAFVVQFQIANNDKYNRFRFQMIVSDDERRLPISFQVKHPKGEIRAELASIQILLPEIQIPTIATPPITNNPNIPRIPTTVSPPKGNPILPPKPYLENQPLAPDLPFALKEKLTFDVFRQNKKIGVIQFEIPDRKLYFNRDAVNLTAKVVQSFDPFLPTGSSFTSYINPESLTPYRSEMRAGGSLSRFGDLYNFDQDRGSLTTEKGKIVEVPIGTYDLLSLAYALRAFRIETTRDTKAALFFGSSAKIVSFKLAKREIVDIGGKKIKAVQLNLTLGDPRSDSLGLKLWLSEDQQRRPLRFSFNSPLGEIRAEISGSPTP